MSRFSTWLVLSCVACSGQSMTRQGRGSAEECGFERCLSKDAGTQEPLTDVEPDDAYSTSDFDTHTSQYSPARDTETSGNTTSSGVTESADSSDSLDDDRTGRGTGHFETTSGASLGDTSDAHSSNEPATTGAAETSSSINTDASGAARCDGAGSRFATSVLDYRFGPGQNVNQDLFPAPIFGPPEANQTSSVVSLGNGGFVVVGFEGNAIIDGAGPDFTVFENPLLDFRELATVAVSEDGNTWHEFPCTAAQDASDFGSCAGVARVYSSSRNGIDPTDPAVSGGDQYDLAQLGVTRARYVRITDRVDLVGGNADVFDLDAVAIINAECP